MQFTGLTLSGATVTPQPILQYSADYLVVAGGGGGGAGNSGTFRIYTFTGSGTITF